MRKIILFVSLVLLSGCFQKDLPPLPTEPLTATGILLPADLSLSRRGTHLLMINGVNTYYVESPTVSLKNLEGERVGLHGTLSRNIDENDLPVLRVDHVTVSKVTGTSVALSGYQMTFTLPAKWQKEETAGTVLLSPEGTPPLLRIMKATNATLPEGISLLVGGRRAVRTANADGTEEFFVEGPSGIVKISTLAVVGTGTGATIATEMSGILKSIHFDAVRSSSAASTGSAGSSTGKTYCGGTAGILCPQGSFCVITDASSNAGYCQEARKN